VNASHVGLKLCCSEVCVCLREAEVKEKSQNGGSRGCARGRELLDGNGEK